MSSLRSLRMGAALLAAAVFLATSVLAIEAPDRKPAVKKPTTSAPAPTEDAQKEPQKDGDKDGDKEGDPAPATAGSDQPATPPAEKTPEPGATPEQPAPTPTPQGKPATDASGAPAQNPGAPAAQGEKDVKDDPEDPKDAAAAAQAPRRFIPSTKSTADNNATFPVDI